uniref:Ras-related protein Rab-44 n=1 Tax=Pelusios castaneus TaxID=367368 RepID=A0A8C8RZS0_9SAUR
MTTRIKEARSEKETLELTLNKRIIDHNREVQQLYEEMEQQINRERQQLQHESKARSHLHTTEVQRALDVMDREVQRLLLVQSELEIQSHSLSTKQHAASTENQRLKSNNQELETQLQQIHIQLQETQGHLGAMKERVSQLHSEERRDRPLAEVTHEISSPSQETLNKEDTSEMQMRLGFQQDKDTPNSCHQPSPYDIPVATEADSGLRTRVISIEEDPSPEFLKEGEAYVEAQQELSDHSSLLRELDDAIAALNKGPEPQVTEAGDLVFQEAASLHPARQGGEPEQRIKAVRDSEHQALSRNGEEPKALPEELAVLFTNQPISQGETLKQGLIQAEHHSQGEKQCPGGASQVATIHVAQELKQRETVDGAVQPPAVSGLPMQITLHKQKPPEGGVLHPDVQQPGASEQAMPDDIQKWASMTADVLLADVRPPAASEQALLKEKLSEIKAPVAKTFEQREPPKQETPPTYFPHVEARHKEGKGNEQVEDLLTASQDTPQAKTQLQSTGKQEAKWVEETKGDMDIFQQEEKQESSMKASVDATPKPGDQACLVNVTTDQPGRAGKGTTETCPDPDHLYNVLFVGDSSVGKTSFLYRLHEDSFNPNLTATVGMDYRVKNLSVDNKCFALRLWDTAGQERYHSLTKQFFRKADGVVLMYDVTSEYSFADVQYWLSCIQEGAGDGVVVLLLGNKTDCASERRVSTEEGERLAKEHRLLFYECSAATGHKVSESMIGLARSLKDHEDRLKTEVVEVPVLPKKKRGCCG